MNSEFQSTSQNDSYSNDEFKSVSKAAVACLVFAILSAGAFMAQLFVLLPIIGIGLYPKLVTQIYDASITQLTTRLRASVPSLTQSAKASTPVNFYSMASLTAPEIETVRRK